VDKLELRDILKKVADGEISYQEAEIKIKTEPYEDLGFAKIDYHRSVRQGASEVIYGAGKTKEQILKIVQAMLAHGENSILITRLEQSAYDYISKEVPVFYDPLSKVAVVGERIKIDNTVGKIVVATGGTSDIPVAEEASLTAEFYGNNVLRLYDVGVSGVHRLMDKIDDLVTAKVIVAVAGMEGALASVIGGMVDCPVIAVPTSVGYGANFGGISALLSMLNSCASGVSVVNIDNGFGAGYLASMINKIGE
jgi:hypothetical protein